MKNHLKKFRLIKKFILGIHNSEKGVFRNQWFYESVYDILTLKAGYSIAINRRYPADTTNTIGTI